MQFKQHILTDNLGVGIEIVGDLAALVIRDVSFGHHSRDKVLILDWKCGVVRAELYTESRRYQSAIFLTPDVVLVTNAHERCLEIWRIPSFSDASPASFPLVERTPEVTLGLPAIHAGFMISEFACRCAPNPILSTPDDQRPFRSSPEESIMVFHLNIAPIDPRIPVPFIFFAHRRTFLNLLLLSERPKTAMMPWANWGPPVTRWLHARAIPTEWITTTSGSRYAFISSHAPALPQQVVLFDFNQNHVRKVAMDKRRSDPPYRGVFGQFLEEVEATTNTLKPQKLWQRIWIEDKPDTYEQLKVFKEEVGGRLPYVAVKSKQVYDFHGILMDDERLLGIKKSRSCWGGEHRSFTFWVNEHF
ncbi:hypothetical protein GYMLUDRAFT_898711 [Collybiopsis luxurians FD-317 M1]|uniref:Uncharacterized protein n=1 Tax=Collybiopsis luxurians FD-317 M1 TaxID=944289 RepID=A0A0D0C9L4_9AGAR|nr:hypothetical protein GYMLUDRAFT_898711 [Collybiopsis luxurians FD-317 M1]